MSIEGKPDFIKSTALEDRQILEIETLIEKVWPEEAVMMDDKTRIEHFRKINRTTWTYLVYKNDRLAGHTRIFRRTIFSDDRSVEVTALAGVGVLKEFRNYGFGKAMVKEVFELVDRREWPTCLFQTNIPAFYGKLGAGIVVNRFYNGRNASRPDENPWWNPYVMIYPKHVPWPEGDIDLNGPAY